MAASHKVSKYVNKQINREINRQLCICVVLWSIDVSYIGRWTITSAAGVWITRLW